MNTIIPDYQYNDDRKFIMEITNIKESGMPKFAIITRRNVPGYPPFRVDTFEKSKDALDYYKILVVKTPLISLNGESPNPIKTIEEYKQWLMESGLTDGYL
jgi:hypothetical protein